MRRALSPQLRVRSRFAWWVAGLSAGAILAGLLWGQLTERRLAAENEIIKRNLAAGGPGKQILRKRLNELRREARGSLPPDGRPDYLADTLTSWKVGATEIRFPYHFLGRRTELNSVEFNAILPDFVPPSAQTYLGVKRKYGEGWRDVVAITLKEGGDLRELGTDVRGTRPVLREFAGLREYAGHRYQSVHVRTTAGLPVWIACDDVSTNGKVSLRCVSQLALAPGLYVETRFDADHLAQWESILRQARNLMASFVKAGAART